MLETDAAVAMKDATISRARRRVAAVGSMLPNLVLETEVIYAGPRAVGLSALRLAAAATARLISDMTLVLRSWSIMTRGDGACAQPGGSEADDTQLHGPTEDMAGGLGDGVAVANPPTGEVLAALMLLGMNGAAKHMA